jgi:hypothetical protein
MQLPHLGTILSHSKDVQSNVTKALKDLPEMLPGVADKLECKSEGESDHTH